MSNKLINNKVLITEEWKKKINEISEKFWGMIRILSSIEF